MKAKYIGFDIDSKKTVACVVQQGQKDRYSSLATDLQQMQQYLQQQRQDGSELHLTFEISGEAGYRYDALRPHVDTLTVSNPHKMTWVYRTSKKNDRIDSRKQAVLLSIGEVPPVHIPQREVRQWRATVQQRRGIVNRIVSVKNRLRALLKANGLTQPPYKGSWWKATNLQWIRQQAQDWTEAVAEQLWRAIKKSPALKAFYEQIVGGQNQRKKVAVVATARKLLTIMRAMLKTGELFNEELVSAQKEQAMNPQNN